jgi:hypothetical protein
VSNGPGSRKSAKPAPSSNTYRQAGWTGGPPLGIGEDEADLGVLEDVVDRVARQLEAHRHRDHAGRA